MTYHPTSRVLTVLELLQSHSTLSGAQIAARLEVDTRTVRRYIAMLQDLGIPVAATPGRHGGYALRPGFKLPPLMLTSDEATALALGLMAVRHLGLAEVAPAAEGALAKIERVLPPQARARVHALQTMITVDLPPPEVRVDSALIVELGLAAREQRSVAISYRSNRVGGESDPQTERQVDPYGVVCHAGHWYTIGHCHLRGGLRVFRLDRIATIAVSETRFQRPEPFDCLEYLTRSVAEIPERWSVVLLLDAPIEQVRQHFPAMLATLEQRPDGVWLRSSIDDLGIIARALLASDLRHQILQPPELREELARRARAILART
jgi:predicted DNA-binding transcriptional regulator YafY